MSIQAGTNMGLINLVSFTGTTKASPAGTDIVMIRDGSTGELREATVSSLVSATAGIVYKGVIDCSANPNYPAADSGDLYIVSVAGKIGGASGLNVEVGDLALCKVDSSPAGTQAVVGANWNIIQGNIDGAVIGPASATDDAIALYDGVTGKLIKNSVVTIDGSGNITTAGTVDGIDVGTDVAANTTHRTSDGSDHSFIDQDVTSGSSPTFDATNISGLPVSSLPASFTTVSIPMPGINGNGFAITTGIKGDFVVPYNCTITGWTLLADQSGSIQVDVWKDTYANFPPTVADTIVTPTITTALKNQATGLSIAASKGDIIRVNVDSVTSIERLAWSLEVTRL